MTSHKHEEVEYAAPTTIDPQIFAGPLFSKGQSYTFTFDEIYDGAYHCAPHPWMQCKIEVD